MQLVEGSPWRRRPGRDVGSHLSDAADCDDRDIVVERMRCSSRALIDETSGETRGVLIGPEHLRAQWSRLVP